jgi:hypothetical protein
MHILNLILACTVAALPAATYSTSSYCPTKPKDTWPKQIPNDPYCWIYENGAIACE